jgi:hypothetical protein
MNNLLALKSHFMEHDITYQCTSIITSAVRYADSMYAFP